MLKDFREFALRGNVVDLAVGVIIGAAFGSVVTSLVNDVIMPPIGFAIGGIDFSDLVIPIAPERTVAGETVPAVEIGVGRFFNAVISFLIVAWAVFLLVRGVNKLMRKADEPAPAAPTEDVVLLREIRDLLAKPQHPG